MVFTLLTGEGIQHCDRPDRERLWLHFALVDLELVAMLIPSVST